MILRLDFDKTRLGANGLQIPGKISFLTFLGYFWDDFCSKMPVLIF